jgi:hypothetical protein
MLNEEYYSLRPLSCHLEVDRYLRGALKLLAVPKLLSRSPPSGLLPGPLAQVVRAHP